MIEGSMKRHDLSTLFQTPVTSGLPANSRRCRCFVDQVQVTVSNDFAASIGFYFSPSTMYKSDRMRV
jgi:hypothetical protein